MSMDIFCLLDTKLNSDSASNLADKFPFDGVSISLHKVNVVVLSYFGMKASLLLILLLSMIGFCIVKWLIFLLIPAGMQHFLI